ncbi:MAG: hypothetical protein QOE09_410 [Ilumatobacteraceae bacterium]|jgi:hypothetical protein
MATSKRDELAKRFADRLQVAEQGSGADDDDAQSDDGDAAPRRASPNHPSQRRVESIGRGAPGGRLRGHLVPHSLHADARRLKLSQQARRGRRITWDDVAIEALELLLVQRDEVPRRLTDVRRLADQATVGPRLVQATIPIELDQSLGELRLDLGDEFGRDVPYEQLWAAALLIWIRAHR